MKVQQINLEPLPDIGSPGGDLLALLHLHDVMSVHGILGAMAGAMLSQLPEVAATGNYSIFAPWIGAKLILMERAKVRGEIPQTVDISLVAQIIPSKAAYQALILRNKIDRGLLAGLIEQVVLPTLRDFSVYLLWKEI